MASIRTPVGLVGRDGESAVLDRLLDDARSGAARVCLVVGTAGIGKSALIDDFLRRSESSARIERVACLPLSDAGGSSSPLLDRLVGGDPDQPVPRHSSFRRAVDTLDRWCADAPTVLVVEDVHWADRTTRDLVTYVVANLRDQRCLLVLSARNEGTGRDDPVRAWLAELAHHALASTVELAGFTVAAVATLIRALTGALPETRAARQVTERTGGNPFFVRELVAGGFLDGAPLPESLRDLLLARAAVVSPASLRTLRVLALAEDQLDDARIAEVAGLDVDAFRSAVRDAVDARLLVPTASGVRFVHELMREALADDLLPGERADLHAAIADALAGRAPHDTQARANHLAQLAHHHLGAGAIDAAIAAWLAAADAAESLHAFTAAHHHLDAVLRHCDDASEPPLGRERCELLARAAEDAFLGGDGRTAVVLAREAIGRLDATTDPRAVGILRERLARYLRDTAEVADGLAECMAALDLIPAEPPTIERARVESGAAYHLLLEGRFAEAQRIAAAAVELARTVGDKSSEADASITLGLLIAHLDDAEVGVAMLEQGLELARAVADPYLQMRAMWNRSALLFMSAQWERTLAAYDELDRELPRLGQAHVLTEVACNRAEVLWRLGAWDAAEEAIADAARRYPMAERSWVHPDLEIARGRFDSAQREIELAAERSAFADVVSRLWLQASSTALALWQGRLSDARHSIDAAIAELATVDDQLVTAQFGALGAWCEADLAEAARRRSDLPAADEAARRAREHARRSRALLDSSGPADGWKVEATAQALQAEAETERAAGSHDPTRWLAAAAAWTAMSMPYAAAYCDVRAAEALLAGGDRDVAQRLLRDAHETTTALGATPLRELTERVARRGRVALGEPTAAAGEHAGLTARELDVLRALSTGSTNRQIARDLFISEKTASVHVSNIIRKLGVTNRGEAAAIAHANGLV